MVDLLVGRRRLQPPKRHNRIEERHQLGHHRPKAGADCPLRGAVKGLFAITGRKVYDRVWSFHGCSFQVRAILDRAQRRLHRGDMAVNSPRHHGRVRTQVERNHQLWARCRSAVRVGGIAHFRFKCQLAEADWRGSGARSAARRAGSLEARKTVPPTMSFGAPGPPCPHGNRIASTVGARSPPEAVSGAVTGPKFVCRRAIERCREMCQPVLRRSTRTRSVPNERRSGPPRTVRRIDR
jgi:hypothetical protein